MSVATVAIANAKAFEAKKTGFGQAQDGWSLTLRIQDEDIPPHVRDAKKGTRYMVALVEIGDNEEPVQRPAVSQAAVAKPRPDSDGPAGALKERRPFGELLPATQAGILCNEGAFHTFLQKKYRAEWMRCDDFNDQLRAANVIRELCKVDSRRDITPDNALWSALVLAYRLWQREAEVVPA